MVLLALPLGVGAAVYLEEYAHDSGPTRLIRTNIRNLAGVPAIVYGLLGLAVFVTLLGMGKILIAGGLTLAIVVLPIVVITASEALRAVPDLDSRGRLRRRCHALGDGPQPCPAVRRAGHLHRHDPGAGPRLRRDRSAADGRGHRRHVQQHRPARMLTGSYTALPTIIFDWSGEPQEEFRALTAAAIVVLLVVILLVTR